MTMRAPRMPALALPFALFAAFGAHLAVGFLVDPITNEAPLDLSLAASACACLLGALLGARANQIHAERSPFRPEHRLWIHLVAGVVFGGAATGAATSLVFRGELVAKWIVGGGVAGLALGPIAGVVLAAARRAERARLGSIVAGTDRREVWTVLGVGLAVASDASLFGVTALLNGAGGPPPLAPALAMASVLVSGYALVADDRALSRARALLARTLEPRDEHTELRAGGARVDLGLGDDVLMEVAHPGAYRHVERANLVVVGAADATLAALARAKRRSWALWLVSLAALAVHAYATTEGALFAYDKLRCQRDWDVPYCNRAIALAVERDAVDVSAQREMLITSCHGGHLPGCVLLGSIDTSALPRRGERGLLLRDAHEAAQHGCDLGEPRLCVVVARRALRGVEGEPELDRQRRWKAWFHLNFACKHAVFSVCAEAAAMKQTL